MEVRRMRSLFALVALCAALVMGVAACGDNASNKADGGGSSKSGAARLFMISSPPGDDFYYTIEQSAKAEAKRVGAHLEIQKYAKYEADAQVPVLNAAIAKHPDAILVGPVDKNSLQAPLERAKQRGIKIITYDTTTRDPSVIETYVSSDIEELGRIAAETQLGLIGKKGKVFYQGTQPNNAFFDSLQRGWKEIMNKQPGIQQLPVVYSDWEPSKASSQMQAILTANPDLRGGFAGIFPDQQGIAPAVRRAGKHGKVELVGVDGAPANVARLKHGDLSAIVSVKAADYGTAMVQAALRSIKGETLPPKTVIGQCVLTTQTLDDPANKRCLYEKAAAS
jgi:ribose transport system substrate-binding protein